MPEHTPEQHEHEIEAWGICRVCADVGLIERPTIPDVPHPEQMRFGGDTFEPVDQVRLGQQMLDVLTFISDRRWHSLAEISQQTGHPEASISARLRDLRKSQFGAHAVERRRPTAQGGSYEYRLLPRATRS